jgi:D-alanyl-D-alanine carboxypeptidase
LRLPVALLSLLTVLVAALPARAADGPVYILVDMDAGTVLDERGSDRLWQPASVTKLMTAYLSFQALRSGQLKATSPVKISAHALDQAPSKMGFKVGTILNVDNALKMMLVKSANDIAMAMAETVGGSESRFDALMNTTAARLGMVSTHYNNPNGLPDDGQVTTARDLAVLAHAIWVEFPEYRDLFGIPAIRAGKRILRSQNTLLERYHGTNGMKTGFVCASGFNMVATATRLGRTLMVVVLGAPSSKDRAELAAGLLNQGFANWFGASGKPQLAAFKAVPMVGPPANLHDQVCGKHVQTEEGDEDPALASVPANSALEPRFVLMPPIDVFTGRADPLPGAPDATAAPADDTAPAAPVRAKVPMPRLRPSAALPAIRDFAAETAPAAPLALLPRQAPVN